MRERLQLRLGMDVSDRTLLNVSMIRALVRTILRPPRRWAAQRSHRHGPSGYSLSIYTHGRILYLRYRSLIEHTP